MKILYAIQGTGNGHLSRSLEIVSYLTQQAQVDVLVSGPTRFQLVYGHNVSLSLRATSAYNVRFLKQGLSYVSSTNGGIDFWRTCKYFKPLVLWHDITTLPVERYDVVVSDCEPISAWACYRKGLPCIQMSNQAAFFSPYMPRPVRRNYCIEAAMRFYIPHTYKIAFHYKKYDTFITTPIIRKEIRTASVRDDGHITVYLPAYAPSLLAHYCMQLKQYSWHIFSPEIKRAYQLANVQFFPVTAQYSTSVVTSHAVICAAGFQATAECLYLGKKMLVIPQHHQYEQWCNAQALKELGCSIIPVVNGHFIPHVQQWLAQETAIQIAFPDNAYDIAQTVLEQV